MLAVADPATGGFIGVDGIVGDISNSYWLDNMLALPDAGCPVGDTSGMTSLTTSQLSWPNLPSGLGGTYWATSSTKNNKLPYLINNPPQ